MKIRSLTGVSIEEIANCFNHSFTDYAVPLQFTPEQLQKKMKNDNISLDLSAGAFENGILTGFILNGIGIYQQEKTAYNGGTGVIPDKRGKGLTRDLYNFILPKLREKEITQCVLEVIDQNLPAVFSYRKAGFDIIRNLSCLRGEVQVEKKNSSVSFGEMGTTKWESLRTFWDFEPSWQNSPQAIGRSWNSLGSITIEIEDAKVAYLIYDPASGKVSQFAVKKEFRNQGFGTLLFIELYNKIQKEIILINIDSSDSNSLNFLKSIGMKSYINQYEMIRRL